MKSKVVKIFDYKSLTLPSELCKWRISDDEIYDSLKNLAKEHSIIKSVNTVKNGDSVACKCKNGNDILTSRTVLIFPGRKLPGAENAEKAVIGKKVGDCVSCTLADYGTVMLEITQCRRCEVSDINDEFVKKLDIDGVDTVQKYFAQYRKDKAETHRNDAKLAIARYWLAAIREKSKLDIDVNEETAYTRERAAFLYNLMSKIGEDPHLVNGELVSDEEAMANLIHEQKGVFSTDLISIALAEQDGFVFDDNEYEKLIMLEAETKNISADEIKENTNFAAYRAGVCLNRAGEMLMREAEKFLEV